MIRSTTSEMPGSLSSTLIPGAVDFYAIKKDEEDEEDEAVMQTYQKAFPNLFKSLSEMPEGLAAHLRYPDYLTRIQARLYGDYYRQASGFYDNSNPWSIPKEAYYSSQADLEMMALLRPC